MKLIRPFSAVTLPRHVLLALPICVLSGGLAAQTVLSASDEASLRTALNTANGSGDFVINVSAVTIALTGAARENANASGDFDITKTAGNLTINGAGAATVLSGAGLDRVFHINASAGVTITFQNLRIENGLASDNGTSQSQEGRGGAIYIQSQNAVTLNNVTLSNNQARAIDGITGAGGGGFGSSGKSSFGGAIYCAGGTLNIVSCTLSQNMARGGNGGNGVVGTNIQGTSICTGGNGGGGGSGGTGFGGGIYLASGTLNVSASTLNANTAQGGDGGNGAKGGNGSASGVSFSFGRGGFGGGGGFGNQGAGGAIFVSTGTLSLVNATLSGNSAIAGNAGNGADGGDGVCIGSSLSKSTMGGNGGNGGNTALARGGAAFVANATVSCSNSTVASNSTSPGIPGIGGAIGAGTATPFSTVVAGTPGSAQAAQGGGLFIVAGSVTLGSTIVSDNVANGAGAVGRDIHGSVTANACVIESLPGAAISGSANVFADAQLLALANNGGPTLTHALAATSPAIDTGSNALALASDQRGSGFPRQFGTGVDMGAFERQSAGAPPPPAISSPLSALTVNAATFNVQGTAPPGALVRVYLDNNNDGAINGGDAVVASQQLTAGQTAFSVAAPLIQNAANNFLATQSTGTESAPVDVPTLTEDSQAPVSPTIFSPAGPINFAGPTFNVSGSAEADSQVRIYRDVNNNGLIDAGDTVQASQQLSGGATSFSVNVPLTPSSPNDFIATSTDGAGNESNPIDVATITEVTVTQAATPSITLPAAAVLVNAPDYVITGGAPAGLLVRIYSDANNNGLIDGADAVVASQQLAAGQSAFAITVTLAQNSANCFTATAEGTYFTESIPADVPTITDDAGFSGNPPNSGNGETACTSGDAPIGPAGVYAILVAALALLVHLARRTAASRNRSKPRP